LTNRRAAEMAEEPICVVPLAPFQVGTDDVDPYQAQRRARKDDERLRDAVDAFLAQYGTRPVVFSLSSAGARANPDLARMAFPPGAPPLHEVAFVLTTAESARRILRPVARDSRRLFRVPSWPVSYWAVLVTPSQVQATESRFLRDTPPSERPGDAGDERGQ
jgi:hypothetical protein